MFRVWSFKAHGAQDYGAAAVSAALPTLLGFADEPEAWFFHVQGVGEAGTAAVSNYADRTKRWD